MPPPLALGQVRSALPSGVKTPQNSIAPPHARGHTATRRTNRDRDATWCVCAVHGGSRLAEPRRISKSKSPIPSPPRFLRKEAAEAAPRLFTSSLHFLPQLGASLPSLVPSLSRSLLLLPPTPLRHLLQVFNLPLPPPSIHPTHPLPPQSSLTRSKSIPTATAQDRRGKKNPSRAAMPRLLPLLVFLLFYSAAAASGSSQVRQHLPPTGPSPSPLPAESGSGLLQFRSHCVVFVFVSCRPPPARAGGGAGAGGGSGAFPAGGDDGAGGPGGGGAGRDGAGLQRHAAAARGKVPALRALHLLRRGQAHLRPRALLLRHQLQHPQPPLRVLLLHAQVLRLPRMQPLTQRLLLSCLSPTGIH